MLISQHTFSMVTLTSHLLAHGNRASLTAAWTRHDGSTCTNSGVHCASSCTSSHNSLGEGNEDEAPQPQCVCCCSQS